MQALPAASESLCIVEMGGTESKEETGETGTVGGLFLNTGLQVGHVLGYFLESSASASKKLLLHIVLLQLSDWIFLFQKIVPKIKICQDEAGTLKIGASVVICPHY